MNNPIKPKKKQPPTRTNWVDPSQKFLEWVDSFNFEKTYFGKIGNFLEQRLNIRKISLIFIGCLILSYTVFFSFNTIYSGRVGEIARRDIKSPISVEVVDDIATESKRLASEQSVPPVFDYDLDVFSLISNNVYNAFQAMRTHAEQVKAAKKSSEFVAEMLKLKPEFEKILELEIPNREFEWLASNRFNLDLEDLIVRIIEKWCEYRIMDSPQKILRPEQDKIVIKLVKKGLKENDEYPTSMDTIFDLTSRERFSIEGISGIYRYPSHEHTLIKQFSYSLLRPNLTLNKQETSERRVKARDAVSPFMISIKKNQVLVAEGSIIEPMQIAIIEKINNYNSEQRKDFVALNLALLLTTLILASLSYTRRFTVNKVRIQPKEVVAISIVTILMVTICKLFWFMTDGSTNALLGIDIPNAAFMYLAPIAAGPMLISLLVTYGEILWLFTLFLSVALSYLVDSSFQFLIYSLITGIVAARGTFKCSQRNDIYWAGLRTGIVGALIAAFLTYATSVTETKSVTDVQWIVLGGFLSGIFSAMISMMLIPLLETALGFTTDVKLMELSNLNHPLLKEMVVKAPGTYHHSLVVGSMVEAASEKIGANPLLAKVMAYYHDIGKIAHSSYFIENQRVGVNPHDHISPFMSKTVLISHVKDGVELGIQYRLGAPIIDGILQHHGNTLIAYFYNKAIESLDEDQEEIPEAEFRYPGPKPQFKEAALIMLADSIEAAARSLDEPTPVRLQNIVKNIIQRKFMEGQLEECNLTLKDLSTIEQSFIRTLLGIHHQRIDYPKSAGGGASLAPEKLLRFPGAKGPGTA
ncbi:MAG: HDIG domain-containing protein [Pseudomonadota bacterium]|nr:HDIG domain-containing protein [Pseudomonadota bacterium]